MRFLKLATATATSSDPQHRVKAAASIRERIASGTLLATGGLGKRTEVAARVTRKGGEISVEDPPSGADWMTAGGYSISEHASKEEAIADAKQTLEIMGDGVVELSAIGEMYPPPARLPLGVVPYLTIEGASDAAAFYQRAFGAREIARMPAEDGKRLMHCHLVINGGALMLSDHFPDMGLPPVQRSASYVMQLVVADGDAWWSRAVEAGCTEKLPFAVAPWGDKYGQLVDPFGVTWAIGSPVRK